MVLNFGEKTMKEIIIKKNEAGQRFDKFLAKYMNQACLLYTSPSPRD